MNSSTFFPQQQFSKLQAFVPYTFLLIALFFAAPYRQPYSLTTPEAHQLWIVQDTERLTTSDQQAQLRVVARVLLANAQQMFDRALDDGQPPAYSILLDFWRVVTGASLVTTRLLSIFFVMLAVALLSRISRRRLKNYGQGKRLAFWLVSAAALIPFTITLARSAEPGAMLFFASALNLWLLLRWIEEPNVPRSLLYAVSLALALYVHLFAVLLIGFGGIVQAARLLQGQRLRTAIDWERLWVRSFTFGIVRWLLSVSLALLMFFPFFAFTEPPTAVAGGGQVLWGLALPWLTGYLGVGIVQRLPINRLSPRALGALTAGLFLMLLISSILITPPITGWDNAITLISQSREPLEPLIIGYAPDSPAGYYVSEMSLRGGISLDLGWRVFTEEEHQALLDKLDSAQAIWLLMTTDSPAYITWTMMLEEQGRTPMTRSSVDEFSVERWSAVPS
jgi:hypothetical protein